MQGTLRKMKTKLNEVVGYTLPVGDQSLQLNPLLNQNLELEFLGQIYCQNCGRKTSKSFSQGYCYPCMKSLAACDICILKPEQCHFHMGTCREPEWGQHNCMVDHVVYLANTSALKVGITRQSQIPTRWIDQGATEALPIYQVKSRHISGLVEVKLAQLMSDKTNWRAMLKGNNDPIPLDEKAHEVRPQIQETIFALLKKYGENAIHQLDATVTKINYPVKRFPKKISSFNFDKTPLVSGILMGIKGQYLIFDSGVINIRKFTGYEIEVRA
ncbi:DUF2797 domain-containing protein [Acaryochloris marina]|uniref:DUF2797 domain-containing protein n=1 Tax=Acaryochloris marina (strain MBIC 11017) TaxID=329726 RepID=A8ZPC7_ACAM1|nr:DUF2797 domain-containing protein [Acaryochloris marina]ABW32863.1 conserved hypothetical protein [Acaryochloris marina MBIC11017]BDM83755.1 hypothetical protein AM10699_66160 [Acaryochloris marina MBIC10699]